MVISIHKEDDTTVVEPTSIEYSYIHGYIYDVPFALEIGIKKNHFASDSFKIGEKYQFFTMYGHKNLELVLSEINPTTQRVTGGKSVAFIFVHELTYKLKHNLLPPTAKAFGASLNRHIIGNTNQLKIVIFELRKKGIILGTNLDGTKSFDILELHNTEYQIQTPKVPLLIISSKKIDIQRQRQNYSSIEADGSIKQTNRGVDRPLYSPSLTKHDIAGLDMVLEPMYILESKSENLDIPIGSAILHLGETFCVIEKHLFYIGKKFISSMTIGRLPE
ncbi:MAG: hypothetical protein ACWGHH_06600 [Sulfurovaceae bacterium]